MSTRHSFGCSHPMFTVCWWFQCHINTPNGPLEISNILHHYLSPSLTPSLNSHPLSHSHLLGMKTCAKNKSKHPAAIVMTPAQLEAASISVPQQKKPPKKQTKDQRIAYLEEGARMQEAMIRTVSESSPPCGLVRLSLLLTASSRYSRR
jgi:hypothetical protein